MAKVSVRVDGLTKARKSVALLPEAFKAQARDAIEIGSRIILMEASARAPYRKGTLKQSLGRNVRDDGLQASVGTGDKKARFVEFATNDTPAQPFLYPGFRAGSKFIRASMRNWARNAAQAAIEGNVNAGRTSIGSVGGVSFGTKRGRRA